MRALLGTASHFCEVVVLKLRTVQERLRDFERAEATYKLALTVKDSVEIEQWSQSSGSNIIPKRARPGLAGPRPHTSSLSR